MNFFRLFFEGEKVKELKRENIEGERSFPFNFLTFPPFYPGLYLLTFRPFDTRRGTNEVKWNHQVL